MESPESLPVRDIHEVLRTHWGYGAFRPVQEEVVRSVMAGRDTLALLPTGGGKSLCFQVPALALGKLCVVISPLIALMKDQVERLQKLGIPARAIVSGMSYAEIDNALESAALGKLSFLYIAPERIGSELFQARLDRLPLGLIAVDEAHCITQWGHDFRPAYRNIAKIRESHPQVPVIALTASATPAVVSDILAQLAFKVPHVLRAPFQRPELVLWVSYGEDKHGRLLRIMEHSPGSAIVYMRDRKGTMRLAQYLREHGIPALAYHAGMSTAERDKVQQDWTSGAQRVVVATNAFGMGIDKADVRTVVHMDLPDDPESYYQEAGRGGRDGKTAHAFLLLAPGDEDALRERMNRSFPTIAEVRRTYQAFADMNRIAMGSGFLETYELDLGTLADRAALSPMVVSNCLKVLELDGRLTRSDGLRSPSRVLIVTSPQVIYHMRVNDRRNGPLIELLLRLHGGLYEEPALIDETRLARMLEWDLKKVTTRLKELDQQRVISYRPKSDRPSITLLLPRSDAQRLTPDAQALTAREARALQRMEAMIHYAQDRRTCRARQLIEYFGESMDHDCGKCDACRDQRPAPSHSNTPVDNLLAEPEAHRTIRIEEQRKRIDAGLEQRPPKAPL